LEIRDRYKVIINCITVKKNSGGAFQIAQNFIKSTVDNVDFDWYYWLSDDLRSFGEDILKGTDQSKIQYFPTQPNFFGTYWDVKKKISKLEESLKADLIYTIASPSYFSYRTKEIMRYANAWHVNLNKFAYETLSFRGKLRYFFFTIIQKAMLKKGKYFITQTFSSKSGILKVVKCSENNIEVIPNTLPNIYMNKEALAAGGRKSRNADLNILYIAVPHPHKNIKIIPTILRKLRARNPGKRIFFHVTIPKGAFLDKFKQKCNNLGVSDYVINHGYCTQEKLIELYRNADLYFFPSLLETFSLSILESIFFKVPMVASDLNFNRDIAKESIVYFSPENLEDAVEQLDLLINNESRYVQIQEKMELFVRDNPKFFNYDLSFANTLEFFKRTIEQ